MLTYSQFISGFSQFSAQDQATVEQAIAQTLIEVSEYEGLGDSALQQQALMLHVAHNLTLSGWAAEGKSGPVKSLSSNNDKIEFAVNPYAGLGLESTNYGARLQALLRRANTVFAIV